MLNFPTNQVCTLKFGARRKFWPTDVWRMVFERTVFEKRSQKARFTQNLVVGGNFGVNFKSWTEAAFHEKCLIMNSSARKCSDVSFAWKNLTNWSLFTMWVDQIEWFLISGSSLKHSLIFLSSLGEVKRETSILCFHWYSSSFWEMAKVQVCKEEMPWTVQSMQSYANISWGRCQLPRIQRQLLVRGRSRLRLYRSHRHLRECRCHPRNHQRERKSSPYYGNKDGYLSRTSRYFFRFLRQ